MADPEPAEPAQGAPLAATRRARSVATSNAHPWQVERRKAEQLAEGFRKNLWRAGRVAEGAPLLRVYRLTPIEGSNPSLSANLSPKQLIRLGFSFDSCTTHTMTHTYQCKGEIAWKK